MSGVNPVVVTPSLGEVTRDVQRLYVVGYDPGVTTGWAVLRLDFEKLLGLGFAGLALASGGSRDPDLLGWDCGTFTGSENGQADLMVGLLRGVWADGVFDEGPESDVVAVSSEDFILRMLSADRDLLAPVRVLAKFDYAARSVPLPRTRASASDAKRVVTDERLRVMNLFAPGAEHLRDATRQAVLLARKMCEPEFRRRWLAACSWLRDTE